MDCSMPGLPVHHQHLEFTQTPVHELVMPSKHLIPSSPSPPDFNLSQHQDLFQWVSSSHQMAKVSELPLQYQSFQWIFSIQGWVPLGLTGLISLLSKGLWRVFSNTRVGKHQFFRSSVFMVQLSHPYMTTGKTIALTRWIFVGKVTPLLFNMLSRFVIAFLPSSKCLLISWLQSPSAVILETKKIKSITFHFSPFYLPWRQGTGCCDLSFFHVES